jgi:TonB-linked SusC/RagA family outer membrane protein
MLTTSIAWAQERTVSGRVTAADDQSALPGVNVVLKGTTTGTVTDTDGNYSLSVPSQGGVLVYTFIGLVSQEVEVGSRTTVDIQMVSDTQQLSEVIITAFGMERNPDELTYVAEKLNSNDLVRAQQTTAAQGLAGKVAGLQVNVQNNGVNPSSQVLLRGLRSISGNNSALIVIDGVIASQGAFDDLNPNDIADINVLKGANAAALYGSDAANGALVITTKNGNASGRFTVGLLSNYTADEVAYMPDFQTKHGIGWAGAYDPIENTNWGPRFDGVTRRIGPVFADGSFQAVPYAPVEDNLKNFFETGNTFSNTVYFSGGNKDSKFYLSIGNRKTSGIVPNDDYKRNTFRINASHKIGKLELAVNSSYFHDETDIVGNTIGDQDRPLYWFILNTAANIPLTSYKDWNNPLSYGYADNYYNAYYQNPYWAIGTNRNTDKTSRLQGNFSIAYDITDKIKWSTRAGINHFTGTGKNWRARQEYDEVLQPAHSTVTSFVEDTEFQTTDFNGSSIINGDFTINENWDIKPLLGVAFVQKSHRDSYMRGNNLSIPDYYDISNRTGELIGTVNEQEERVVGFFGEVNVGYKKFLYLNVTGRQDYTSTLPLEDNGYFYPSIGLSFVGTEAIEAIRNSNIISDLRLTLSNSTVYNDLDPYAINERYTQPTSAQQPGQFPYPLGPINAYALSGTTVDAGISKEKLNTTEIGAGLGFLKDRFYVNASYFTTKITDLIVETTPSYASGATLFLTNIGELESKGIELSVGGTVLEIGDFKWKLNVNYTTNETIVKEISGDLKEIAIDSYAAGYGTFAIVNEAFPQIKASSYVRDPQGRTVVGADGNPLVGEVVPMGKATPDYILGVNSEMSWKGFEFAATIDYRTGHVFYEQGSDQMEFTGRSVASVSSNRQDFVWPNSVFQVGENEYVENTSTPITGGIMTFWQNRYNEIKENYVKDATALKLREVAVNYTLPRSLLAKTVINKLTVGFVGRNLVTFLPEENRFSDPEFNNFSEGTYRPNSIGIGGYMQSPPTRSYGFNLNIEF